MIVVREAFQLHYGKAGEGLALVKEMSTTSSAVKLWRQFVALRARSARFSALAAMIAACSFLAGALAQPLQWDQVPELEIVVTSDAITAPATLEAGFYRLAIDDRSGLGADISIGRYEDGATLDLILDATTEVNAAFMGEGNPGPAMARIDELVDLVGGASQPASVIELTPGEYTILSVGTTEDGQNHFDLGMVAGLTVTENAAMPEPPTPDVTIQMVDFAFAIPADVRAGQQTWEVVNAGAQIHHLILLRPAEGRTIDDLMAYLQDPEPQGPPPAEDVAATAVLSMDESNYLNFDLAPGDYLALCFMPDFETGMPHVELGMLQSFTVPGE